MRVVVYKTIPQRLTDKVKHLDKICFPWIFQTQKARAEHKDKFTPSLKDQIGHVCAFENDKLICRVILYKRKIEFEGQPLILGGIGGVCTIPEKRRQGLATKLLKMAMTELKKSACDIAYLCADVSNPGMIKLYQKVGFTLLVRTHIFYGQSGKRYKDNDAMVAPVKSKAIFQEIMGSKKILNIGMGNW